MIKQEVNELKRLYTPNRCSITRICGCYVDGEKNKKPEFKEAFGGILRQGNRKL